ncbi:hypothetical protein PTTG_29171 [Puccinia triticina 1-1 BBBD Race 1]|uniref:THOC2_N domain-containing protein n=1 Tax=Puccinia triticina (isolate 1-1 / race 1 (BBBD)) TaxID=630390 RepID=A0A180G5V6_PUCT1|nr:hypothetical protein PTTG_29171 [Puccinia triticina 1-1 BBBD Race 1]
MRLVQHRLSQKPQLVGLEPELPLRLMLGLPRQVPTKPMPLLPRLKKLQVSSHDLRMIVNVLDSGECSSKTFSHTVTFIQAISTCPNGREVIAAELLERAKFLGDALLPDLDELSEAIRKCLAKLRRSEIQGHWMQAGNFNPTIDDEQILPADGTLPSEQGSRLIASLLRFKFTHYQQSDSADSTPEELYLMTAESNWRQEVMTKALNAGPQNSLSMAGALDNSGLMGSYSKTTASEIPEGASATASIKSRSAPNQKAGLLSALLSIGALHESLFILSIPNHQYLAHQDPNISALFLRLVDVALDPAYRKCELSVQNSKLSQSNLTRPKKRYAGGPAHLLIDAEVPKSILSARVIPRVASLGATSVKTEPVFFWPA